MRKELIEIEKIEQYLLNTMSKAERTEFENQINSNGKLKAKVEAQQIIMDGVGRMALKQSTKNAHKNFKLKALLTKLIALIAIIAVAGFITLQVLNAKNSENSSEISENSSFLPENDSISNLSNKMLEEEVFRISTQQDTVIENKDGVVIYIPANAFDTDNTEIDLMVQSALSGEDILYAGLSTTSNGDALETGGMFYVDAFANGTRVNLVKDLQVEVPTDKKVAGMQLYAGEKTKNGDINWVKPTPLKNSLTPVDILTLDFFPPTYDVKLSEWGYPKKDFKDSLYYSFAFDESEPKNDMFGEISLEVLELDTLSTTLIRDVKTNERSSGLPAPKMESSEVERINYEVASNQSVIGGEMPASIDEVIEWNFKSKYIGNNNYEIIITVDQLDGWHIYSQNQPVGGISFPTELNFAGSGIELIGKTREFVVTLHEGQFPERVFNGRKAIFKQKIHVTKSTSLNIEYGFMACKEACFAPEFRNQEMQLELREDVEPVTHINPASIKTIWNTKFNNTNLATKEFEERLVWIHKSCHQAVLDIYINNLDKPLYEVDLMVIDMVSGEVKTKFIEFAKRKDGKVELDDVATQKLSAYYKTKTKAYTKALLETQKTYWDEQAQKDVDQQNANTESYLRDFRNKQGVFNKELSINLCKVYTELKQNYDCNRKPIPPPKATYSVSISSTGWNNIDKQVFFTTLNRETSTIEFEGKTSTLTYDNWTGSIPDYETYDRINVYNIPKTIKSYVKLQGQKGKYTYKLNAYLEYETVVLAWNENQLYYTTKSTKKGKETFELKPISEADFKTKIKDKLNHINTMTDEIDYIINTRMDDKRVKQNVERKKLCSRVEAIVFPCFSEIIVSSDNATVDSTDVVLSLDEDVETH
jgi:hypothetical protein